MSNGMQTVSRTDSLKEYDVTITETLQKTVKVEAAGEFEAEQAVREGWRNSEYILDADNFIDVEYKAVTDNQELLHSTENTLNNDVGTLNTKLPLIENEHVKELLDVLKRCDKDTSGITSLLSYVDEMEGFVKRMEGTISSMKTQLDSIKDSQNHPIKNFLKNTIAAFEKRVAALRDHIGNIKSQIVEGCKNAVKAFKETGISALANLARFFPIKKDLIQIVKNIDREININNKTVSKIEAFTKQYHAAGRHLKNMARVAVGREPLATKKEAGMISKAIANPYLLHNKILKKMKASFEKAIKGLDNMQQKQEEKRAEKKAEREIVKKPSLLEKLAEGKARVEQAKLDAPALERAKAHGVEV